MEPERKMLLVRIILRATAALFGVIILGVIEQNVLVEMYGETGCAFDMNEGKIKGNKNACNFGLAVGVLALIAAIVLTAIDLGASVLGQSGETAKKLVTIADLISSVVMAFLSLAAFAYLTDLWTKTGPLDEIPGKTISSARAAIAFCFLSAIIWVVLAVLDGIRLRSFSGSSEGTSYDKL